MYRDIDAYVVGIFSTWEAAVAAASPKRGDSQEKVVSDDGITVLAGGYTFFIEEYEVQE